MKEKPQFKVLICRRNNFLIICLVLVWVRFLLHSRYMSGKPFVGREDQWMHFRLIPFIKSTKFKRDPAKRDSMSNLTVYLDEVTILVAISLSRCFPERDHSMGIVYRSSASRRSNRKRNSQKVFAWTLEVFDILILPSLALKRFLYSNPRFSNFSLFRGIPLYLQNSTTMFPKRRIPAAVFATENTRLYPIKRRRWKQNGNSGYLDPSKCFQKLKNVAIHLKELVVHHCFEERI